MRPVPRSFLLLLLVALCALCAWQWHRESSLRHIAVRQRDELAKLKAGRDELEARVKTADAEILRLTGALNELRTGSVAKAEHEEVLQANARLREAIEKQNTLLAQQTEAMAKANAATQQANDTIKALAEERDRLATRLNEITSLYNKLTNRAKP